MPFPVAKPQVAPCVRPLAAGVQLETVKKIAQAIFRLSTLHMCKAAGRHRFRSA